MARRKRESAVTEGDFTSMLDLIFNLLAFFVVTFKLPKPELNFDLTLPPPKKIEQQVKSTEDMFAPKDEIFKDVSIRLVADDDGDLASILVEGQKVEGIPGLIAKIQRIGGATGAAMPVGGEGGLEAANIIVDPNLKYVYVITVVDACYLCNLTKINFGGSEKTKPGPF